MINSKTLSHKTQKRSLTLASILLLILGPLLTACGSDSPSFSLDGQSLSFGQTAVTQSKVDILWVIDNSGSMSNAQSELTSEFQSFISSFASKNFDFHMSVTTTDAYRAHASLNNNPNESLLRDGTDATSHTGVFVLNANTPNLEATFVTNALQGINGYGDERGLHSMMETLKNPGNSAFYRGADESFLSVIIVSDEEDFSHSVENNNVNNNMGAFIEDRAHVDMDSTDFYIDYLDTLTGSTEQQKNYSVNTMAMLDQACLTNPEYGSAWAKIGTRYKEIADKTNGIAANLCDDFATSLDSISGSILSLATKFILSGNPIPETITIKVNGAVQASGWFYNAADNSIQFDANSIPPAGSSISVEFDPASFQE